MKEQGAEVVHAGEDMFFPKMISCMMSIFVFGGVLVLMVLLTLAMFVYLIMMVMAAVFWNQQNNSD